MATLKIGFSVTPDGVGAGDGIADPSFSKSIDLVDGDLVGYSSLTLPENTAASSTILWEAANHGVSTDEASATLAVVEIDPLDAEDTPLPAGVMASYTTDQATTVTTTVFEQAYPGTPLCFLGTVYLPNGDLAYLTKLDGRNRNTGTSDAMKIRTKVWK
jgi:hypothetical protein